MTAMIESTRHSRKSRRPAQGVLSALRASALFLLICSPAAEAQSLDHSTDELRKLNQSIDALIKKVSPSVVQILVTGYGPLEETFLIRASMDWLSLRSSSVE